MRMLSLARPLTLVAILLAAYPAAAQDNTAQPSQPQAAPAQPAPPAPQPAAAAQPAAPQPPKPEQQPECAWAGERILSLLWRDDIRTASDFIDLYDRFSCPSQHIPAAFRCLIRVGVTPEQGDAGLPLRARACWADPALDPATLKVPAAEAKPDAQKGGDQGAAKPADAQPAKPAEQPK